MVGFFSSSSLSLSLSLLLDYFSFFWRHCLKLKTVVFYLSVVCGVSNVVESKFTTVGSDRGGEIVGEEREMRGKGKKKDREYFPLHFPMNNSQLPLLLSSSFFFPFLSSRLIFFPSLPLVLLSL